MTQSQRVLSGSRTKGSTAKIVYPDEYSGSNTLDRYNQGVNVQTVNSYFSSTVMKLRSNNNFLKLIDGKIYKGDLRPYDAQDEPASFAAVLENNGVPVGHIIDGKGTGIIGEGTPRPTIPNSNGIYYNESNRNALLKPDYAKSATYMLMHASQIPITTFASGSKTPTNKNKTGVNLAVSHFRLDYDLGMTDIFQDGQPFLDSADLDPVNIVTVDPLTLDVPSNMVNASDSNLRDGVLEPFDLRSVIDRSHLEIPYLARGCRADLVLTDAFRRSETIEFQSPTITSRTVMRDGKEFIKGCDPYLDGVEVFGLEQLGNRAKVLKSLTTDYSPAMTAMGDLHGSGPVYEEWWSQFKSKDLYGPSSGPIVQPGFLNQPVASIVPFRDGTDREDTTSKLTDEILSTDGTWGDLNWNFEVNATKYTPLLTGSTRIGSSTTGSFFYIGKRGPYGKSRPRDLVLHARLDKSGSFGDKPSLRSQTGITTTLIMYQSGAWGWKGNNDSSPYTADINAPSAVPVELDPSTTTINTGQLTGLILTSSQLSSDGQYHSPFSPVMQGTRAWAGSSDGNPTGFLTPSGSTPGSISGLSMTQIYERCPTRGFSFGVWMRGDGDTNYHQASATNSYAYIPLQ